MKKYFSEYLHQMENKYQIMDVHTKWNCLMSILSIVRLNIAVSGMNNCLPASQPCSGGWGWYFWGMRHFNFHTSDKASCQGMPLYTEKQVRTAHILPRNAQFTIVERGLKSKSRASSAQEQGY